MLIFFYTFAQEEIIKKDYPEFYFGFYGGGNIATMHGSEIDEFEEVAYGNASPRPSGNAGITLTLKFNKILAVQSGLTAIGKGYKILLDRYSGSEVTAELFQKRLVTYLEVPLQLRAILDMGYAVHFFVGTSLGFVVSAKEKIYARITKTPLFGETTKEKEDISEVDLMKDEVISDSLGNVLHYTFNDFYRRNDIMLILGMAIEQRFNAAGLFLEFQYNQGLLNFNDLSDKARKELADFTSSEVWNPIAKFRTFCISVGVNIYIKDSKKKSNQRYPKGYY